MIAVNGVSVMFGGFTLFDSISFQIDKRDRIGLTGRNGAGKSTLLKIIAGENLPTEGNVATDNDCKVGYLPQTIVFDEGTTVRQEAAKAFSHLFAMQKELEVLNNQLAERTDYESDAYMKLIDTIHTMTERIAICGLSEMDGEIEVVLKGLGFKQSDLDRPCSEFSGGWRMRVELAKLLLMRPDIFLLDEPTNHLDIESITWLERFLQGYSGAVVVVSHDRAFLDNITNRTIEISLGKIYDYKVPYSQFESLRAERVEQQTRAYMNQQKQIKDTEEFIERFRYKATKAVQVQSRIKQLDKIERIEVEDLDTSHIVVRFQPVVRPGDVVLSAKEASKSYGDNLVIKDVNLSILRGEKVAFVGKNGEGKSTLVKMAMNQIPYDGDVHIGHNVHVGYFAQNQADLLDPELTVFDTVDRVAVGDIRKKLRDILGAFLFSGEDIDKKVKVLSGGERTRLAMVTLLLEPYNVLILDEPTNHLDLKTKGVLKEALRNFEGTVICVSHDRDFLNGLVDKVYEFADHQVKEFLGGISEFLEAKKISCFREYELRHGSKNGTQQSEVVKDEPSLNKLGFEERKQLNKEIRKAEQAVQKIEKDIESVELQIAEMEEKMATGVTDEALFKSYGAMKQKLELLMEEWESANATLDECRSKLN